VAPFCMLQMLRHVRCPPSTFVILEDGVVTYLHIIHNSIHVWLIMAVSPFLQNKDDMLITIDGLGEYLSIYSNIVLGYEK
jgi:hypothetical protein